MTARFRIIATVFEPTIERAIDVIRSMPDGVDGIELRVDRLGQHPTLAAFEAVRASTPLELIMTRRTTADHGSCASSGSAMLASAETAAPVTMIHRDGIRSVSGRTRTTANE